MMETSIEWDEADRDLEGAYAEMAVDAEREAAALEWIENLVAGSGWSE